MMRFGLQNEKTRTALAEAGSLALAEFITRPQAELKSAPRGNSSLVS